MRQFLISDDEVAEVCYDFTVDHEDDFLQLRLEGHDISACQYCVMRFEFFRPYALARGYDISVE